MEKKTYAELIQRLEDDELEQINVSAELYTQLIAAYLYQNELTDAKFCWKRIPAAIKTDNKELERLNVLIYALLNNNYPEFFNNINYSWSEIIKPIMDDLLIKTRDDVFNLIGMAYTSIYEPELAKITNLPVDQLRDKYSSLGWEQETTEGQLVIVLPKRAPPPDPNCGSSEDQLLKLTEFVSFLEN